jgi:hypothetical protein
VQYLQTLILRALRQADSTSILGGGAPDVTGLAIIPPVGISLFSQYLNAQEIEIICLRTCVEYIQTHQVFSLKRIVCLEFSKYEIQQVGHSSFLAENLFLLVRDKFESSQSTSRAFVSTCHDVVVMSLIEEYQRQQEFENDRFLRKHQKQNILSSEIPELRRRGTHVVLLRGTPSCLLSAVKLIQKHISSS